MNEELAKPTTVGDLLDSAREEILDERVTRYRYLLKERIRELEAVRKVVKELEESMEKFLEEPLDGDVFSE
jgi:hypothetical protein